MTQKLLVDTCVWLDLAKDHRQEPIIAALEDLVRTREVEIIVPQIVLSEFERNKARVTAETRRIFQSHIRLVRQAVDRFGDDESKSKTLHDLAAVNHKIGITTEAINNSIDRIHSLLKFAPTVPTSDSIKQRVTERAILKTAPYHRNRNNVADAILIEIYADQLSTGSGKNMEYAFVTQNTKDFSALSGDRRKPHVDIESLFDPPRSTFWVSIVDLIRTREPDLLAHHETEFGITPQSRSLFELIEAEYLLFRQVWYNRHWNLRTEIEDGKNHVVSEKDYSRNPYRQDQTLDSIWEKALAAAKRTEDEFGLDNLGPWNDFEWGMINGKLSAIRWILGDDWDMLDT